MSVTVMARVFWTDIPSFSYESKKGKRIGVDNKSAKLTLLAIADNADDFGENSWQSFDTLAQKTGLERRSVIRVIHALIKNDYCKLNGITRYGTNDYAVNLSKLGNPPVKRARTGRPKSSDSGTESSDSGTESSDSQSPESSLSVPESSIGDKSPSDNLPLDWKIANEMKITEKDIQNETDRKMKDAANLISTTFGVNSTTAYDIAYTFQTSRWIIIPTDKVKGQRKAIKEMLEMHVQPEHIIQAVKDLTAKNMTITDLFSVSKTAIALANPAPKEEEQKAADYKPQPRYDERGGLISY